MTEILFSIIIPTLNRTDCVRQCLSSILSQAGSDSEIILVDQNPDPVLLENVLHEFLGNYRIVRSKNLGASHARNLAARQAHGQYLFFMDDDAVFSSDCLSSLKKLIFNYPDYAVITGDIIDPENGRNFTGHSDKNISEVNFNNIWSHSAESALVIKKDKFYAVGYFDENLSPGGKFYSCEGTDLFVRMLENKFRILFCPNFIIYHPIKANVWDKSLFQRVYYYSIGNGAFFKKNLFFRRNYRLLPHFINHLYVYIKNVVIFAVLNPSRSVYFFSRLKGICLGFWLYSQKDLHRENTT